MSFYRSSVFTDPYSYPYAYSSQPLLNTLYTRPCRCRFGTMTGGETLQCPFCEYINTDDYFLLQHVELIHPEDGDSPWLVKDLDTPPDALTSSGIPSSFHPGNVTSQALVPSSHLPSAAKPDHSPCPTSRELTSMMNVSSPSHEYIICPNDCGESILRQELANHMDLHYAEDMLLEDAAGYSDTSLTLHGVQGSYEDTNSDFSTKISRHLRNIEGSGSSGSRQSIRSTLGGFVLPPDSQADHNVKRLGKADLGPYANEKRMPTWLHKMLEKDGQMKKTNIIGPNGKVKKVLRADNHTSGLVPVLAHLLDRDPTTKSAVLCSPMVRHVAKLNREGGFCGYRNIQMIASHLCDARKHGAEAFGHAVPGILTLQDMIENAWDRGINVNGRRETGGIRGTRKYIGTPEAQTLFAGYNIGCEARGIGALEKLPAFEHLYLAICEYFYAPGITGSGEKVEVTDLPPIFFQHQGHSMTIIGIETRTDNKINLLVFDPMFRTSPAMERILSRGPSRDYNEKTWLNLLKPYRKDNGYLKSYKMFEILSLADSESPK